MRPAVLLLGGLALVGGGLAVILSPIPGHWVIGVALMVVGLLVKLAGFAVTDDPVRARPGSRRVTTLDGQVVEAPRPGVPTGRATVSSTRPVRARHSAPPPVARPGRSAGSPPPVAPPARRAG